MAARLPLCLVDRPAGAERRHEQELISMALAPRRPRTRRGIAFTIGAGLVVVAVVGFAVIYFVLFPTSSPKPLALSAATAATPVSSGAQLTGTWKIAPGSVAGYRVREKLGFLPAESDAVGRTSQITGSATVAESKDIVTIRKASFVVAVNTLKSNESMRDQHIQTIGIQSATYPKATFVLSSPLILPATALNGHTVHTSATGVFNIHGTARQETVALEMRLSDSKIQSAGSLTFPWGRFNMTAPSIGGFVNVSDKATMEFKLELAPS
jgi:polyisoprenoid-binding protein YceI